MIRHRIHITLLLAATLAMTAGATTNIDSSLPYGWGENIGWIDYSGDGANGVVVSSTHLSGFAWSENCGWINLGAGPSNTTTYSQAAGDTGVNNSNGNLSGYAWGENIGWIVFDTTGSGGSRVTIDPLGQFHGYAWGENVGWISMDSGFGVIVNANPPLGDVVNHLLGLAPGFNLNTNGDAVIDAGDVLDSVH